MQNLQSQLGKSLSLQLLMTVPRWNVPGGGAIWLQVKVLSFPAVAIGHLVWLKFVQMPA